MNDYFLDTLGLLTTPNRLNRDLYPAPAGGAAPAPNSDNIHQGNLDDCWFVSSVINIARFRPNMLNVNVAGNRIIRNGTVNGTYDVAFRYSEWANAVQGVQVTESEIAYYKDRKFPGDGMLLIVLEKAYGLFLDPTKTEPIATIDHETAFPAVGPYDLTGDAYTVNGLRINILIPNPLVRRRISEADLSRALASLNNADPMTRHIVNLCGDGHVFTIVQYTPGGGNFLTHTVLVQDPYFHRWNAGLNGGAGGWETKKIALTVRQLYEDYWTIVWHQ